MLFVLIEIMRFNFKVNEVKLFVLLVFVASSTAVEYSEKNEGYAQGFLPICPGYSKPADIKPEHLHRIKISVLGNGSLIQAKWTSYNYQKVKALAKDPNVDFSRKTIMYIPGYLDSTAIPVGRSILVHYEKLGYNVLVLEYVSFSTNIWPVVARVMRPVSKHVAEMLANLTTTGLDPKKLELIGLSLGGICVSLIAKNFQQITGRNISKITALDPAGPCVRHHGPEDRLNPSDADFVLHVATNTGGYGMATPAGHVSVYVNGGEYQPGILPMYLCDNICSHLYVYFLWISALEHPGKFIMMQCDSLQQAKDHKCFERQPMISNALDVYTDGSKPGIYYLATSPKHPFYLGKKGLKRGGAEILKHISDLNAVDILRV